jgi:hypothetical protein
MRLIILTLFKPKHLQISVGGYRLIGKDHILYDNSSPNLLRTIKEPEVRNNLRSSQIELYQPISDDLNSLLYDLKHKPYSEPVLDMTIRRWTIGNLLTVENPPITSCFKSYIAFRYSSRCRSLIDIYKTLISLYDPYSSLETRREVVRRILQLLFVSVHLSIYTDCTLIRWVASLKHIANIQINNSLYSSLHSCLTDSIYISHNFLRNIANFCLNYRIISPKIYPTYVSEKSILNLMVNIIDDDAEFDIVRRIENDFTPIDKSRTNYNIHEILSSPADRELINNHIQNMTKFIWTLRKKKSEYEFILEDLNEIKKRKQALLVGILIALIAIPDKVEYGLIYLWGCIIQIILIIIMPLKNFFNWIREKTKPLTKTF